MLVYLTFLIALGFFFLGLSLSFPRLITGADESNTFLGVVWDSVRVWWVSGLGESKTGIVPVVIMERWTPFCFLTFGDCVWKKNQLMIMAHKQTCAWVSRQISLKLLAIAKIHDKRVWTVT